MTKPGNPHKDFDLGDSQSFDLMVDHMDPSVSLQAPPPFVSMMGSKTAGMMFMTTGSGTVAGFPNVMVEANGEFMESGGIWSIIFEYLRGVNNELPGGQSSDYDCSGQRVGP